MSNLQDERYLRISSEEIKAKLSNLSNATVVKDLSINPCNKLCEKDFKLLLSHYCYLESIVFKKHGGVFTDDHLKIIGEKLKNLRFLEIAMHTSITNDGLDYLSGENNSSEENISCPRLESLYIWKATGITAKGVGSITSKLQHLKDLDVWVTEVDSKMFQCAAGMKSLKKVGFRSQNSISLTGSEVMKQAGFEMHLCTAIGEDPTNGYIARWNKDSKKSSNAEQSSSSE